MSVNRETTTAITAQGQGFDHIRRCGGESEEAFRIIKFPVKKNTLYYEWQDKKRQGQKQRHIIGWHAGASRCQVVNMTVFDVC